MFNYPGSLCKAKRNSLITHTHPPQIYTPTLKTPIIKHTFMYTYWGIHEKGWGDVVSVVFVQRDRKIVRRFGSQERKNILF